MKTHLKFEQLAGKRILGIASSNDYSDWAESLLYDGVDSQNVAILAGFGMDKYPDSAEVERYFLKCIKELGLILPSKENGIKCYAKYLCNQIITEEIEPEKGLSILESLFFRSNYEPIFCIWDELSDDVWQVNNQEEAIFNSNITPENIPNYIKKVAQQFLTLIEIELPKAFFQMSLCPKCGFLGKPISKRAEITWLPDSLYRLFFRKYPTCRSFCSKCGESRLAQMWDYDGREKYLNLCVNGHLYNE